MKNLKENLAPSVKGLKAYGIADARGLIKLDSMENPYPLPEAVLREWQAKGLIAVNRYPDPTASEVRAAIHDIWPIPEGYDIVFGNGSDELISMQISALGGFDSAVMSLEPGFAVYRIATQVLARQYIGVDLNDDFSLNLERTLEAINEHQPAIIFIAYPNNPTGNLFDIEAVAQIIEAAPGVVVLDEAYTAFASDNWLTRLPQYPNAVIQRTLSKSGLAGIRLGVLIAPSEYCEVINRVRMPYNINVMTQELACIAMAHQDLFTAQTDQIIADRERQFAALSALDGVIPFESQANFILVRLDERYDAPTVCSQIKEYGVLTKCFHDTHPLLFNSLRVTIGTECENHRFLEALKQAL